MNATVNVIAEISPNWDVGMKLETVITIKPETNTIVEVSIANPVVSIVLDIAISMFEFFFFSCQNLNKKCSESSTAIPKQIENVIANWSPYKSFGSRVLWQWVDKGMPVID